MPLNKTARIAIREYLEIRPRYPDENHLFLSQKWSPLRPRSIYDIVKKYETYVGGKPRKRNRKDDDKYSKRGRGTKKIPVIGIVDTEKKKVYAKVSLPNEEGKRLSGNQLLAILNEVCKSKVTVITDEFTGYSILRKTEHIHLMIDHSKGFLNDFVHTNNVESFWAVLKRGIYGIYHHVSVNTCKTMSTSSVLGLTTKTIVMYSN